jgi:hypothetical protein
MGKIARGEAFSGEAELVEANWDTAVTPLVTHVADAIAAAA